MITKLLSTLKKWALPLVALYAIALSVGSLMSISSVPNLGSSFDDKIYHCIAYFLFTILAYNYCRVKNINNPILISAVLVIAYGIIIEVLQHIMTSYRTLDVYDALANSLGVVIAALILSYRNKLKLK